MRQEKQVEAGLQRAAAAPDGDRGRVAVPRACPTTVKASAAVPERRGQEEVGAQTGGEAEARSGSRPPPDRHRHDRHQQHVGPRPAHRTRCGARPAWARRTVSSAARDRRRPAPRTRESAAIPQQPPAGEPAVGRRSAPCRLPAAHDRRGRHDPGSQRRTLTSSSRSGGAKGCDACGDRRIPPPGRPGARRGTGCGAARRSRRGRRSPAGRSGRAGRARRRRAAPSLGDSRAAPAAPRPHADGRRRRRSGAARCCAGARPRPPGPTSPPAATTGIPARSPSPAAPVEHQGPAGPGAPGRHDPGGHPVAGRRAVQAEQRLPAGRSPASSASARAASARARSRSRASSCFDPGEILGPPDPGHRRLQRGRNAAAPAASTGTNAARADDRSSALARRQRPARPPDEDQRQRRGAQHRDEGRAAAPRRVTTGSCRPGRCGRRRDGPGSGRRRGPRRAAGLPLIMIGRPVSSARRWSRPRSSAPPPVRATPCSMMSAASSGGVASMTSFTASTTATTGPSSASRISAVDVMIVRGRPVTRSRPRISAS